MSDQQPVPVVSLAQDENGPLNDEEQPSEEGTTQPTAAVDENPPLSEPDIDEGKGEIPEEYSGEKEIEFDVRDHFSLKQPSSTVRCRNRKVQVYELANDQLQLEHTVVKEERDKLGVRLTVQRLRGGSIGFWLLRGVYTLLALLMFGFLCLFAAQTVVFQVLEIPRHSGNAKDTPLNVQVMVATFLSIPLTMHNMASLLVLASVFVTDTWNGHPLFALLMGRKRLAVEWYCFIIYLAIPAVTTIVLCFAGVSNWTQIGKLVWYGFINFSFLVFCALVFYFEIKLCLDFTKAQYPQLSTSALIQRAALLSLTKHYSGTRECNYLVTKDNHPSTVGTFDPDDYEPVSTRMWPYSYMTTRFGCLFDNLESPQRRYSVSEIRESVPFVTNQTWSLQKNCCRNYFGRSRFVISGPSAVHQYQSRSTLSCVIVGVLLAVLFVAGLLYAMGQGAVVIVLVTVVMLGLVGVPMVLSALNLFRALESHDDDDVKNTLYQAWASFTVAKPKEWYCWLRMAIAVIFFFLWPMVSLYVQGLPKIATLFLGMGLFSGCRLLFDLSSVVNERGTLSNVPLLDEDPEKKQQSSPEKKAIAMATRALASEIMGKVSNTWKIYLCYVAFAGIFVYFIWQAITSTNSEDSSTPQGGRPPIRLLDDFYYPPQEESISYPGCLVGNSYVFPGQNSTYAIDYIMLGALGYETTNVTGYILPKWFGEEGAWVDETPFVNQWRRDTGNEAVHTSWKLFSKPSEPGVGIVSIRGTETTTDSLLNTQIYMSTAVTMIIRALMPFSWIFDDVYAELCATASWTSSDQLQESAYYRVTTNFVNSLLQDNYAFDGKSFDWLRTTGVSLGGGLALITGAQTEAFGFATAGINPTLGRFTWDPPLSIDDINTKNFNIIPDNDRISKLGDAVRNVQRIECRYFGDDTNCHSFWRSMCEFQYTCGTPRDRSVLCTCVYRFAYPEPLQKGNRTFDEACAEEEAKFNDQVYGVS